MAYFVKENAIVPQLIAETSTTQNHPLGTIVRAKDPTYGEGEFIYLKGVASTAVADCVIYDQYAATTTRTVAGSRGPCAWAMSANVASQYGWYQISGAVVGTTSTVVAGASVYVTATPGSLDDAVVATDKIEGARFKTANGTPAAGQAIIMVDRPSLNGNG